jgi:3-oxoacyl-[acyl-carrier-protein] synthase II
MERSIGITGLGVVSPLGLGIAPLWEGLLAGTSALAPITRFDASGFACCVGGEVPNFSAKDHVPKHYRKAVKVMARDIELAVAAAKFAVEDAKLITRAHAADDAATPSTTYAPDRMGCQIGAGLISAEAEELTSALATSTIPSAQGEVFSLEKWGTTGLANLQPLWMLKYLPNMLACHVTILHGAEGPSNTITCGEASGLLSLGESCRVIERGAADLCFSGGAESKINVMGLLRAELAGKVGPTPLDTTPADAYSLVRPYDPRSIGVPSEAGGILILENLAHAKARNAHIYAKIVGFGAGQAGWPPYSTRTERVGLTATQNRGLRFAITRALRDANLTPDAIDAIVPQAAGSRLEDDAEAGTLAQIFGQRLASIPLVTLTPNLGNSWAGSGGVAAAVAAMILSTQTLPARIHAGKPREGLQAGRTPSTPASLRNVLVCSSSLGGQNAALILQSV